MDVDGCGWMWMDVCEWMCMGCGWDVDGMRMDVDVGGCGWDADGMWMGCGWDVDGMWMGCECGWM
jgi:hypothetical protein